MSRIVITVSSSELAELVQRLEPKRATMALSVAVNDTVRQTKLKARPVIAKESSLKSGRVAKGLKIDRYSTPSTLSADLIGSGRPVSLGEFGPRKTRKGVSAKVWGRTQRYPGSFIVRSGAMGVYHRTSQDRFPIRKMWGAGVAQVMAQEHVSKVIVAHGQQRLEINAQRQLDRYIAGAGGAGR
jgi:hypothetical protein